MKSSSIFKSNLLAGTHALITGGGTGIGFGCALELGALGARVTIAARREEVLQKSTLRDVFPASFAPRYGGWCSMAMTRGSVVEVDFEKAW